jgi:hypothetical protein
MDARTQHAHAVHTHAVDVHAHAVHAYVMHTHIMHCHIMNAHAVYAHATHCMLYMEQRHVNCSCRSTTSLIAACQLSCFKLSTTAKVGMLPKLNSAMPTTAKV